MKASQIREMTREELEQKHRDLREEHFNLRFQAATGQIEKPHLLRAVRRDIARVLSIIEEQKEAGQ
ncbi:MAG: 50S ribosomal protein L29 [Candidatus Erginobacter occultus]|nr:50S ribosomal protein L29 [Candidatus Erginobacter occultus]